MPSWDPTQYEKFATLRDRPFLDLLSRVGAKDPRLVVDLGCGNGPLTLLMAQRWPDARIIGIDSSPQMIERAREVDTQGRVEWQVGTVEDWDPATSPDVLITNATLQWVPTHRDLIPRWLQALPEDGWFAMQVPGNFDAPSHRLIRETVAEHPRAADLVGALRSDAVEDPTGYADLLATRCSHLDVWETTYLQMLDPAAAQRSPVLEWVRGTGLRPVLDRLRPEEVEPFEAALTAKYDRAYPRKPYGVPFEFRRVFAVGSV